LVEHFFLVWNVKNAHRPKSDLQTVSFGTLPKRKHVAMKNSLQVLGSTINSRGWTVSFLAFTLTLILSAVSGGARAGSTVYNISSSSSLTGNVTICQGLAAPTTQATFSNCTSGSGGSSASTVTVKWYYNTTGETGTLNVSTELSSVNVSTGTSATVTFSITSVTASYNNLMATPGDYYIFCTVTRPNTGCAASSTLYSGTSGSSGVRRITVLPPPTTSSNGGNQTLVACATTTTLTGNTPTVGSGTWTVSPTGPTITNSGSPNSSVTGIVPGTTYTFTWTISNVPCANSTSSMTVIAPTGPGCQIYCSAAATSTSFEKISNVTFNTINNNSTSTAGYEDFTGISTTVAQGTGYSFSANILGAFASDQIIVWIDYNGDGDFLDAGEQVFTSAIGVGPHVTAVTIPVTAGLGTTRMRVRLHDTAGGPNSTSCGTSIYGQVEDYTINIIAAVACSGTPTAGSALASPAAVCPNFSSVLSLVESSNDSGLTYQWEQSDNGTSGWINSVGGSGATTSSYTTPGLTSAGYYRCVVTCVNSGESSVSSIFMVDVVGSSGIYQTVNTTNGQLPWNTASTWECGLIPPTNGTADVIIQTPPTVNLNANFVSLPSTAIDVKSIVINSGASLKMTTVNVTHVCRQNFNIEHGGQFGAGNWTGGGTQSFSIGGDVINNGSFGQGFSNGNYDYVVILNGNSPQSFSGIGTSTFIGGKTAGFSQLVIANTSIDGVTLGMNYGVNNGSGVAGKVVINEGSTLRFSSEVIQIVNGNSNQLDLNGTTELKAGTFNAHYAMTGIRTISTSTSRIIYSNPSSNLTPTSNIPWSELGSVTTDMGETGLLTIGGATTLHGELAMVNGDIATTTTNLLTVGVSNTSPGTVNWQAGTVLGPLRRWFRNTTNSGDISGIFPVGNVLSGNTLNRWVRIEHTSAPSTAGYLTMQFIPVNPTTTSAATNGLTLNDQGILLSNIAPEGYWLATAVALSGGMYSATLRVNVFPSVMNYLQSRLIKSPGSAHTTWVLDGNHGTLSGTTLDYVLSRNDMSNFSYFAVAYPSNTALPVELIAFTAQCQTEQVEVKWSTASEYNSSHFVLQVSEDGYNWSDLYVAEAAGFSNTVLEYTYTHKNAARTKMYYRLNQYDYDGALKTYNPIMSNCTSDETVFITFPNPSVDAFTVVVNDELLSGTNVLTISDASGKAIYSIAIELENGSGSFALEGLDLPAGLYYLQLNNGSHTSRVIKHSFR
jgi:hypothetical protein